MARCSAVINSSTGFSHVLIIGSGEAGPPSLPFRFFPPPLYATWTLSAGPAGLVCAETLRQEGFTDRIVMCTMDRHPPYDRPKLSKVCTQRPKLNRESAVMATVHKGSVEQRQFPVVTLMTASTGCSLAPRRIIPSVRLRCTNLLPSVFREHSRAAETALRRLPAGPRHRAGHGERGESPFFQHLLHLPQRVRGPGP